MRAHPSQNDRLHAADRASEGLGAMPTRCVQSAIDTRDADEVFDPRRDVRHVVSGGTKILQHAADRGAKLRPPDGGCLALVQRTGFATSQGKLMRRIMFATEPVSANSRESALFILFFLVWAIVAAAYVLYHGLQDETRSRCVVRLSPSLPNRLGQTAAGDRSTLDVGCVLTYR
jgi:magnesium-transporting ATPase (P-type)